MDERQRRQRYRAELFTAGMAMGLALFAVMALQYLARGWNDAAGVFLSFLDFAAVTAVLIIYGRRAAALCPPDPPARPGGFTYGRAFGFSLLVSLLAGVVAGLGYYFLAEAVDPAYYDETVRRSIEAYEASGLFSADQLQEASAMMHNLFVVILANVIAMAFEGGFIALFTSAVVRRRGSGRFPPAGRI